MPELGEIRKASEIGKGGNPYQKYRWTACETCGESGGDKMKTKSLINILVIGCLWGFLVGLAAGYLIGR